MTSEDPHKRKKIRCQFCLILTHLPLSLRLSHHSSIDQLSIIVRWFYCGWFFCNVFAHCVLRVYQIFIRFFGPTSFHHRHSFCVCVCLRYCENVQIFNIFGVNKIISIDYSILCAIILWKNVYWYGKKKKWGENMPQWKRPNCETSNWFLQRIGVHLVNGKIEILHHVNFRWIRLTSDNTNNNETC